MCAETTESLPQGPTPAVLDESLWDLVIGGQNVTLPFTAASFGEDFTLADTFTVVSENGDTEQAFELFERSMAILRMDNSNEDKALCNVNTVRVNPSELDNMYDVKIGKIYIGNRKTTIHNTYGAPISTSEDGAVEKYVTPSDYVITINYDGDKISAYEITMNKDEGI